MKKRILLGTIVSLIAPLTAVIACSTNPGSHFTDEDKKAIAEIKTPEFKKSLENLWIEEVIKLNYNKEEIEAKKEEIAEFIIFHNLQKDPAYLSSLATTLRTSANSQEEKDEITKKVSDFGFNEIYHSKKWDKNRNDSNETETAIKWLLKEENRKRTSLYEEIQKILVSKAYLSLDKKEWQSVFENDDENKLSSVEKALTKDNFTLLKEAVSKKYFLKWNTTLDEDKSRGLRLLEKDLTQKYPDPKSTTDPSIEKIILEEKNGVINKSKKIENFVDYFGIKKELFDPNELLETFKERPGFQGLGEVIGTRGKLDFSISGWENYRDSKDFLVEGYLQDDKLVKAEDYKIEEKSFDITRVVGILPFYDEEDKKIKFNEDQFNLDHLKTIFALENSSLFDQAVEYFTKKKVPVSIDLGESYLNELLDEDGNPYIVETEKRNSKNEDEEKDAEEENIDGEDKSEQG